jgi:tellurite resistance protein TerC
MLQTFSPAIYFPFSEYWWLYGLFLVFILLMLALDLGVFNRKAHVVEFKEALTWSIVWVVLALIFNALFYLYAADKFGAQVGKTLALEFLTGYVLEKSLSVDNIFVFVLVFGYFAIPAKYRHRVLFYGILGALVFRGIFITLGSALMEFQWVIYLFGAFLIVTGFKMFFVEDEGIEPEKNFLIRLFRRFIPVTHKIEGQNFFIKQDGKYYATPLFIALLFLEASDVIFAVDSVPAIFAVTKEPLIVFTSNIFAILGLRAMYFMLAGVIDKFHLLKVGLAVVLVFVGVKMVLHSPGLSGLLGLSTGEEGFKIPIELSLAFILTVIFLSVILSLVFPKKDTFRDR